MTALFQDGADAEKIGRKAASVLGFEGLQFSVEPVEDVDWVQQNRDQFQPIKISDRVWIVPTWHVAPDDGAINIALDPGAAFGTGSHPTTRLCLQWLEANLRADKNPTMLDYGCGSGILAIAAKKQITIVGYEDRATGQLGIGEFGLAGKTSMQKVTLHPRVTVAKGTNLDDARAIHIKAHANCFMANSVSFPITTEPEMIEASA